MSEYVGVKDHVGCGMYNRYVTDEPIVRCRDCEHARMDAGYCALNGLDEAEWVEVEPDGFCKWGVKDGN